MGISFHRLIARLAVAAGVTIPFAGDVNNPLALRRIAPPSIDDEPALSRDSDGVRSASVHCSGNRR